MNAKSPDIPARVAWITNLAAPYRRPVWAVLAESVELSVLLLENATRFRRSSTNRGSEWAEHDHLPFNLVEIPTLRVRRGEGSYYVAQRSGFVAPHRPDAVLLAGWESPAFWQALSWSRRNKVRTVAFYESTLATQRHTKGPLASARRRFFTSVDRVVVPGEAAEEAVLAMGVDRSRIDVGFNAVDVAGIHRQTHAIRSALAHDGEAPRGHRFLYLGRLIPLKNVDILLDAFAAAARAGDSLTIAGSGPEAPRLQRRVEELGLGRQVTFTGMIDYSGVAELLALHDTLVLPSGNEVWGLVINEALAAGLHTVVTDNAGVARSVSQMPGVYITPVKTDELATAMTESRQDWRGHISSPPILEMTPRRFADVFLNALVPQA